MHRLSPTRQPIARPSRAAGFTLPEIIAVMVVVSILMAVAIPSYMSHKRNALSGTAKSLARSTSDAVEACASAQSYNNYTKCDITEIIKREPDLADVTDPSAVGGGIGGDAGGVGQGIGPNNAEGAPGGRGSSPVCVPKVATACVNILDGSSYVTAARVAQAAGGDTLFVIYHTPDATKRLCVSASSISGGSSGTTVTGAGGGSGPRGGPILGGGGGPTAPSPTPAPAPSNPSPTITGTRDANCPKGTW